MIKPSAKMSGPPPTPASVVDLEPSEAHSADAGRSAEALAFETGVGTGDDYDEQSGDEMQRMALRASLQVCDPKRSVARPASFFDMAVDSLFDAMVVSPEDLATLKHFEHPSAGIAGFLNTHVIPAARSKFQGCTSAFGAEVGSIAVDPGGLAGPQPMPLDIWRQQLELFGSLASMAKKKEEQPLPVFDLHGELERIGLARLTHEGLPKGETADWLFAKALKLSKTKKVNFVLVKCLAVFLPQHSSLGCTVADESDDETESHKAMRKVMRVTRSKKTLTFLQCLEALHRYVVIAAACKQFELASGMTHIMIVMKVASLHGPQVAVMYDEKAREKWASAAAYAGLSGSFSVDNAMRELDDAVVELAKQGCSPAPQSFAPEVGAPPPPATFPRKGKGKGAKFEGTCNYCGKQGHRKVGCFKRADDEKRGFDAPVETESKRPRRH